MTHPTLSQLKSSLLAEWYKLAKESMRDGEAMVDEFGFSSFFSKALDQVAEKTAEAITMENGWNSGTHEQSFKRDRWLKGEK